MAYKIKNKVEFKKDEKRLQNSPYKLINREDSVEGSLEVWQLPKSQYAIQYLNNEKGDKRWRVMEVYISKDGEIRTRGDLPYKDYESYLEAFNHIETNARIENQY
jgi:hypothetical protein